MRSTSAAWTAATMTSPYDRAVESSTTMAKALILLRGDNGSGWCRPDAKIRQDLKGTDRNPGRWSTRESQPDWAVRGRDGVTSASRPAGPCRRGRVDDSHAARRYALGHRLYHDGGSGRARRGHGDGKARRVRRRDPRRQPA